MADGMDPVARISGVSHRYGKVCALDDVTLDIPAGGMVGLIGPDGVGKSTLLGLLAGARRLQTGGMQVLGGDMGRAKHRRSCYSRIAYMPQGLGRNLYFELSIRENLEFFAKLFGQGRAERAHRIDRLLRATGLDPFIDRPAGKLSGGMKQKLGLCCALIHDPDFLILDEPTTGVDPLSRRQFWDLIDDIRAERPGMSVLVSTAYMDEAGRFDHLIAMNAGQVLASGAPHSLMAQTGADTLEDAFLALLPGGADRRALVIPPPPADGDEPAIRAHGLTKTFGDFTAVKDVSFAIPRGEIFGFLGSNGCGKTTTMKMLTGLLDPSAGQAWVLGHPADASDLDTRKRVGFMTQSFSLYKELTIQQNLWLHGRLFEMPRARIAERVEALLDRFGLQDHRHDLAGALPLGLRQRLSLAVAVIHGPEILILDEPTSGVDPVARDSFWELLIDLSRNDRVTIFISTHFMNEAARCDRISLMHAGQVLVCDTPTALADTYGGGDLEEAFVNQIARATGQDTGHAAQPVTTDAPTPARRAPGALGRLMAYSRREFTEVLRDPIRLAFAFLGSLILLSIFAYGLSFDVDDLHFAVFDQDQTPESRAYLSNFSGSRYFIEEPPIYSIDALEARMAANEIWLAIEIPEGFGRDLKAGHVPGVSAWIDGANPSTAATIEGYVNSGHTLYLSTLNPGAESSAVVDIETRYQYNPSLETIFTIAPSIPAVLLMLIPAILMAVSIARERETGTITNFHVTPTRKLEFLIGKQMPYVGIGMANFLLMVLMAVYIFRVPLKGDGVLLTLAALAYLFAATGVGMLMSCFTRSQVAAVFATAVLAMVPTVNFSGLVQPVSTLEGAARNIGTFWPTTYYMETSVGVFTKGLGFAELGGNILILIAFSLPLWLASSAALKKQEP
ncbi:ribosome-associated ATPase/putative transporter RbbA [Actibacterium ureilyticum]|uniref:ribosome-associated ATPase/putative transporter RbbA n=1 Tax=Actibacterium ureilyticum TaxID=1590614 RepID=UPI000BAA9882|nr:ribosome-associated ATPase/putative transporter RbbA [Actibacterium ureilyticum]